jgi:hypothetical protein
MDQNQIIDNQNIDDDLQKAIDNITNATSVDPVFSDPVAAPSSIPEGDTGELDESVGPFPEPEAPVTPTLSATPTEQFAPVEPVMPEPTVPEPTVPEPANFTMEPTPIVPPVQEPAMPHLEPEPFAPSSEMPVHNFNTAEVKKAALRDLIPVLDKININSVQKFKIYRDIFEELRDYTVLGSAYEAAREIPDETTRAEALLYLVEAIDKM